MVRRGCGSRHERDGSRRDGGAEDRRTPPRHLRWADAAATGCAQRGERTGRSEGVGGDHAEVVGRGAGVSARAPIVGERSRRGPSTSPRQVAARSPPVVTTSDRARRLARTRASTVAVIDRRVTKTTSFGGRRRARRAPGRVRRHRRWRPWRGGRAPWGRCRFRACRAAPCRSAALDRARTTLLRQVTIDAAAARRRSKSTSTPPAHGARRSCGGTLLAERV